MRRHKSQPSHYTATFKYWVYSPLQHVYEISPIPLWHWMTLNRHSKSQKFYTDYCTWMTLSTGSMLWRLSTDTTGQTHSILLCVCVCQSIHLSTLPSLNGLPLKIAKIQFALQWPYHTISWHLHILHPKFHGLWASGSCQTLHCRNGRTGTTFDGENLTSNTWYLRNDSLICSRK